MSGQMLGGAVGAAIGNPCEPTLEEARAEFDAKLGELTSARNRMTETTNPEVFAFRARAVANMCYEMLSTSSTLASAAEKAASK